jgi:hypothetical protein
LHLTEGADPFGPRTAAAPCQTHFSLAYFLIEHLEHVDPDL